MIKIVEIRGKHGMTDYYALAQFFGSAWNSGCMTRSDRHRLANQLSSDSTDSLEKAVIRRLLHATRRGWIQLVDG